VMAAARSASPSATSESVRFYVLAGPVKGWAYSSTDDEFQTWRYSDPERHPDADLTYKYVVALPGVDTDLPVTILFTRTSTPAARQLNTILKKAAQSGPTQEVPLELTGTKKARDKYKWVVFGVRRADVPEKERQEDIEKFKHLIDLAQGAAATQPPGDAPEPNDRPEI